MMDNIISILIISLLIVIAALVAIFAILEVNVDVSLLTYLFSSQILLNWQWWYSHRCDNAFEFSKVIRLSIFVAFFPECCIVIVIQVVEIRI